MLMTLGKRQCWGLVPLLLLLTLPPELLFPALLLLPRGLVLEVLRLWLVVKLLVLLPLQAMLSVPPRALRLLLPVQWVLALQLLWLALLLSLLGLLLSLLRVLLSLLSLLLLSDWTHR